MRSFITNNDVPIGYVTPSFPSLHWPISNGKFSLAVLYDVVVIWKFTLYWSLIFNGAFYGIAGLWASYSHRRRAGGLWIMAIYLVYGGIQAVAAGTVIGFLIGSIYSAGLFSMSTWIPPCCVIVQILFDFSVSYLSSGTIMWYDFTLLENSISLFWATLWARTSQWVVYHGPFFSLFVMRLLWML